MFLYDPNSVFVEFVGVVLIDDLLSTLFELHLVVLIDWNILFFKSAIENCHCMECNNKKAFSAFVNINKLMGICLVNYLRLRQSCHHLHPKRCMTLGRVTGSWWRAWAAGERTSGWVHTRCSKLLTQLWWSLKEQHGWIPATSRGSPSLLYNSSSRTDSEAL